MCLDQRRARVLAKVCQRAIAIFGERRNDRVVGVQYPRAGCVDHVNLSAVDLNQVLRSLKVVMFNGGIFESFAKGDVGDNAHEASVVVQTLGQ